ncbi:hypothetical protein [Gynurincola endophyticus]|uniref:hypothetical protein n=1 Tax=Gynurincola endophyticus TaxID=2479004 RepID=UPI000F8E5E58|nr:hypothetical protein [Gynurincola endophyticus]
MKMILLIVILLFSIEKVHTQNRILKEVSKFENKQNEWKDSFNEVEKFVFQAIDSSVFFNKIDSLNKRGKKYLSELDSLNTYLKYLSEKKLIKSFAVDDSQQYLKKINLYRSILQSDNLKKSIGRKEFKKLYRDLSVLEGRVLSVTNIKDKILRKLLIQSRADTDFLDFFSLNSEYSRLFSNPWMLNDAAGLSPSYQNIESVQFQIGSIIPQNVDMSSVAGQVQEKFSNIFNSVIANSNETYENADSVPSFGKKLKNKIEYSFNLQSQRSTPFWPMTSDLATNVGYRLNSSGVIGIGISAKVGWGSSIQNIRITQEGFAIRSFIDYKVKSSFYLSGGFELNHQPVKDFQNTSDKEVLPFFSQSGLIGISKIVSINHKFFKKTKAQVFWDFLSYRQIPFTSPIKFRIGYTL